MAAKETVLVTGGSGFVGAWCIIAAIQQGYHVRSTIRSLKRTDEVRGFLTAGDLTEEQADSVEILPANLSSDDGWTEACKGCSYVLHVASPFPAGQPKHEDDLIVPAREGTLRVLRAAKEAGSVKRIVVTSSVAAIGESPSEFISARRLTECSVRSSQYGQSLHRRRLDSP